MASMLSQLMTLLENQRKILKIYALGALLFFIGLGFIQWAEKVITPSLEQELYALAGVSLGGAGFVIAMSAQILLIVSRFTQMGQREHR